MNAAVSNRQASEASMIADLKPYTRYKESGIRWIGEVPRHWETRRLRHTCDMRVSNVDKHTKPSETLVRLCNYMEVYKNERIRESTPFMVASASEDERLRFAIHIGDVLITKDSEQWNDIGVPALVEFEAADLLCGYHLAILRARPGLDGPYLHRAIESHFIAAQFHLEANGVTRYGLSQGAILGVTIPIPPPNEQAAIVRFLDWAIGRLAQAIRAKRRIIGLLTEQQQAITHAAVTGGLDRSIPLKPSGVPWLGDIPEHWEVLRSKYLYREVDNRSATGEEPHLSMSQKFGLIPSSRMEAKRLLSESYAGAKLCKKGDLVLNRLKAHLGVFALAPEHGLVSPDYTVLRPVRELDERFFEAIYRTPACRVELRQRAKGIVQGFWRLYTDDFYDIRVPVPPVDEQRRIMDQLNINLAGVNSATFRLYREVELLREFRTRLISDVVTGKLDVRNAAVQLPEEVIADTAEYDTELSDETEIVGEDVAV